MGAAQPGRRRAVFLDRDGVINRNVLNPATGEFESPLTAEQFEFIPGSLDAMRDLQSAGFLLFLVSNQPNIAKGKSTLEQIAAIHERLCSGLAQSGIEFSAFYYCFHHPRGTVGGYSQLCVCRKPSPYFLLKAGSDFSLDLRRSWMIGDRPTDIECGKAAGTKTVFIHPGNLHTEAAPSPDKVAPDLFVAARFVIKDNQPVVNPELRYGQ